VKGEESSQCAVVLQHFMLHNLHSWYSTVK